MARGRRRAKHPKRRVAAPVARKRSGRSPAAGTRVLPWELPEPWRPPGLDEFGPPLDGGPPEATKVASGRGRPPRVPSTVSRRPRSPRLEETLRTIQHFEATETNETAYDATLAAGPAHLLVAVNFKVVVLSKAGRAPLAESHLRAWFDSVLPANVDTVFDPRVLYDQYEDRWVLVASAVHYGDPKIGDEFTLPHLVLSVSQTADPTGGWWIWSFPEQPRRKTPWPDHPSLGVDLYSLYLSTNLIGAIRPARLRIIPKAAPYAGHVVTYTDFEGLQNPTDKQHPKPTPASTVFPCHTWGAPGMQFLVSTRRDEHEFEASIVLWTVKDPGRRPQLLPPRSVPVPGYAVLVPDATQKVGPLIWTGDARVRNAVYCSGSIWFAFATAHTTDPNVGCARWYQLDPLTATLFQEGNFAVTRVHHCYPAIIPDVHGNATLVVGRSGPGEYLSVQVSARRVNDPPGQLPPSSPLHLGVAGHDNPDRYKRNRWGDYNAAALDPLDGVTVWVCGAYPVSEKTWGVCVGSVRV